MAGFDWSQCTFKCMPCLIEKKHLAGLLTSWKHSKEGKMALVFYSLTHCINLKNRNQLPTGAILAVFWRLTQGDVVSVDNREQYRPWGATQTVEFSQRNQIWEGLETCHTSALWTGGLVWLTPVWWFLAACLDFLNSLLRCLRANKSPKKPKGSCKKEKRELFLPLSTSKKCKFPTFTFHLLGNISSQSHKINGSQRDSFLMPWTFHVYNCATPQHTHTRHPHSFIPLVSDKGSRNQYTTLYTPYLLSN